LKLRVAEFVRIPGCLAGAGDLRSLRILTNSVTLRRDAQLQRHETGVIAGSALIFSNPRVTRAGDEGQR